MDGLRNLNLNEPEKKKEVILMGWKLKWVITCMAEQVYIKIKTLKTHAMYQLPEEASYKVKSLKKPANKGNFQSG